MSYPPNNRLNQGFDRSSSWVFNRASSSSAAMRFSRSRSSSVRSRSSSAESREIWFSNGLKNSSICCDRDGGTSSRPGDSPRSSGGSMMLSPGTSSRISPAPSRGIISEICNPRFWRMTAVRRTRISSSVNRRSPPGSGLACLERNGPKKSGELQVRNVFGAFPTNLEVCLTENVSTGCIPGIIAESPPRAENRPLERIGSRSRLPEGYREPVCN